MKLASREEGALCSPSLETEQLKLASRSAAGAASAAAETIPLGGVTTVCWQELVDQVDHVSVLDPVSVDSAAESSDSAENYFSKEISAELRTTDIIDVDDILSKTIEHF